MPIDYPYLPEGKTFLFAPSEHPFMREAKEARETLAGDTIFPVGAVLVKEGRVIGRGGNGFNQGSGKPHICPRVVLDCKSGEGYDLCSLHESEGHAERMAIADALSRGEETFGADIYLFGHWWACEPCWQAMIEAGIANVYLLEGAQEIFSRDRVYEETLKPSVKTAYIAGALTYLPDEIAKSHRAFYEDVADVCAALGIAAHVPHLHTDPETHPNALPRDVFEAGVHHAKTSDITIAEVTYPSLGTGGEIAYAEAAGKPVILVSHRSATPSRFVRGNPAVAYHLTYETYAEAVEKLSRILRQL